MARFLRLLRLIALMLASARLANNFAGILFDMRDGAGEEQRIQLGWTAVGALCGAAAELWVRGWRPSRRIGVWGAAATDRVRCDCRRPDSGCVTSRS